MADGTYRKIENIQEGDYVINMDGKPVKVKAKMDKGERNIVTVSSGKLAGTKITPDHKILTLDVNTVKTNWIEISNVTGSHLLVTPNNIQWNLQDAFIIDIRTLDKTIALIADNMKSDFIRSDFNIGFIFGQYLSGQYQILSDINIRKLFTPILTEKYKSDHYIARCKLIFDKIFSRFLDGKLPPEFKCTDKNYINGMINGMNLMDDNNIDIDGQLICTSSNNNVLDVFEWCCLSLNKAYIKFNNNLIIVMKDNVKTTNYIHYPLGEIKDIGDTCKVWDIEVDCPTHSFIAEGIVVHNSVCTTRKQTGVGYPQLSAIIECADAAHGLSGCIISDGGCTVPGDIAKAFGAGADFVMLGGMFSGHDESGGATINEIDTDGNEVPKWKEFYGMSSKKAMDKYSGGVADYRSSEGKAVRVPYKGSINDTVLDILGGLRSACTYIGALKLKELSKRTTFIRTTQQLNNVYGKS
jgi:IMP dehydrogenase/GMP reductase